MHSSPRSEGKVGPGYQVKWELAGVEGAQRAVFAEILQESAGSLHDLVGHAAGR